jgi:hypothetical protein
MLRPTDIISLARATMFCLRPIEQQINIYMQWWRQAFYNIKFVKKHAVLVFGKDIDLLKTAIQRWDYIEANKIKLLTDIPAKRKSRSKIDDLDQIAKFVTTNSISIFIAIFFYT